VVRPESSKDLRSRVDTPSKTDMDNNTSAAAVTASARPSAGSKDVLEQTANSSAYIGDGRTEAHRAYYLDWLKVFLTVLVILHQCVTLYYPPYAWAAKKDDIPLQMFSGLFLDANTAYFMALLFFISGLFVPGSYSRKGATKFLLGRTLRLMVPCVICSLLITPFSRWWNELAKNPLVDPVAALMEQFKLWLTTGGWPTTYNIGAGPVSQGAVCGRAEPGWNKNVM